MWQPINTHTNQHVTFSTKDWPLLIHGAPKAGSSFFTVALTARYVQQGKKVVFLCAKGDAIRALQQELMLGKPMEKHATVTSSAINALEDMQLVTLMKKRGSDILETLRSLKDWGERIVVVKNVEEMLTPALWAVLKPHRHLIVSGDFEKMNFEIDANHFTTAILFSVAPAHWKRQRTSLPSYIGDVYQGDQRWQTILREE